jgi:hypothetical protein
VTADPLAIATALTTLIEEAYTLAESLYGTVNSLNGAPTEIAEISTDTQDLVSILANLQSYLDDEENSARVTHRLVARNLADVLKNTISVLKELQLMVQDAINGNVGAEMTDILKALEWNFREGKVQQWRQQLYAHKMTLNLAISMANLFVPN